MLTVKLTTPWHLPYQAQSPGGQGIWGNYKFEINNDCDEADFWIVWGWEQPPRQHVRVPANHLLYITDEAHSQRYYHVEYLGQFTQVASPRKDLQITNLVTRHEMAPWYLPLSWDEMVDLPVPEKTLGSVSVITSSLTHLEGHLKRFAFVNQLRGHFKNRLEVFGRGIRPVEDKREAFFPYAYSIALENSSIPDYFTEKVREIFLGYGFPFYWGCPNLEAYFHPDSFVYLDVNDYQTSIEKMEEALAKDYWGTRFGLIKEQRHKVLYDYHLFPSLASLLDHFPEAGPVKTIQIKPEATYWKEDTQLWHRIARKAAHIFKGN